ncbi:hypothetical protein [Cupriavidus sp. YR651]|uniref:hypothetical protein n=1 Tax=Cupriavidus sp. YR651 TaxID=1855315 RepID=UPI000B851312|nr:hypothetical protein [Cupriavidus sp. YR651]
MHHDLVRIVGLGFSPMQRMPGDRHSTLTCRMRADNRCVVGNDSASDAGPLRLDCDAMFVDCGADTPVAVPLEDCFGVSLQVRNAA